MRPRGVGVAGAGGEAAEHAVHRAPRRVRGARHHQLAGLRQQLAVERVRIGGAQRGGHLSPGAEQEVGAPVHRQHAVGALQQPPRLRVLAHLGEREQRDRAQPGELAHRLLDELGGHLVEAALAPPDGHPLHQPAPVGTPQAGALLQRERVLGVLLGQVPLAAQGGVPGLLVGDLRAQLGEPEVGGEALGPGEVGQCEVRLGEPQRERPAVQPGDGLGVRGQPLPDQRQRLVQRRAPLRLAAGHPAREVEVVQRPAEQRDVAEVAGDAGGLAGGVHPLRAPVGVAQLAGQRAEQLGPPDGVVGAGQQVVEPLDDGLVARAVGPPVPQGHPAEHARRVGGAVGVAALAGERDRPGQRGLRAGEVARRPPVPAELDEQRRRVVARAVGQLDGPRDVLGRGDEREPLAGRSRRGERVPQRAALPGERAGQVGVVGQRVEPARGRQTLQRPGDRAVQPGPLQPGQPGHDRLADQVVPEPPHPAVAVLHHHPGDDGGLQQPDDLLGVELGGGLQHVQRELAADHRGQGEQGPGVVGQPAQPTFQHVADRRGDVRRARPGVQAALAAQQLDQLDEEERVALGTPAQVLGQPGVGQPAVGEQLPDLGDRQPVERQPGDGALPGQVGEGVDQRVGALVGRVAQRRDHQHRQRRDPADEEAQQVQRERVGAVQVVEDDEQRPVRGGRGQRTGDLLEQLGAAGVGVALPGAGRGARVGAERAQHLRPRPQRGRRGLVGTPAPGHPDAERAGGRGRLLGQPGLADPGLAAEQHHRPAAARRRRQSRHQRRELRAAADETPGGGPLRLRGGGRQRRRSRPVDARVLRADRLLQAAQLRAGVDAQLVAQQVAAGAGGAQRVGLAPGAVQREHQRSPQPLPQRVHRHQRLQLGDRRVRTAGREQGLDVPFQRHDPQLGEAGTVGGAAGVAGVAQVGVGLAAP
nr:hypothetical protein [Pseudonocardia hydrocarbonoxydans]